MAAQQRLAFLDAGRGVAALLVVVAHALALCVPGFSAWSRQYLDLGRLGVVVFLLISGYIIPASLEHGGSQARFWLRRFFRLFPAYWLSIALAYVYLTCGGRTPLRVPLADCATWLVNLTMLQGFVGRPAVWDVFWTLKVELVVYAACSLLFAGGLLRRTGWGVCVAAIAGYAGVGVLHPLLEGKPYGVSEERLLYLLPLIGLAAQRCVAAGARRRRLHALPVGTLLAALAVWVVNKALFPGLVDPAGLRTFVLNWGAAFAVFFLLLEARDRPMLAVSCWLGRVSYSVYLFHPLVLILLLPLGLPAPLFLVGVLAASLALSALTYHFVEEPGIALGRLVERRLLAGRPAAEAAPRRRAA